MMPMTEILSELHFLRPAWFAALALVPLLVLFWRLRARQGGPWDAVVAPQLRPWVLESGRGGGGRGRTWALMLALLGFVLAVVALAGPAWRKLPQPVYRSGAALVIAFDLSRSMDARDVAPSRLARARLKLLDLLERRTEGQTALIVYAAEPFVVTPLTNDAATIAALVESLSTELMPAQGSRADRALQLAAELIEQAGAPTGDILLITDGANWRDAEVATSLRMRGLRVSVLGVGTRDGAPIPLPQGGLLEDAEGKVAIARLDEDALREVARRGGGAYASLRVDDADLDAVLLPPPDAAAREATPSGLAADIWREEGPWLLIPLCMLASFAFRRGWVGLILLAALPASAHAFEWDALWKRDDQRAVEALEQGDPARAAQLFGDPEWKGSALYRAGDYAASAQALAQAEGARAHYNRGNALARAGHFMKAIDAYEQSLELDPKNEDARYNLELLKRMLQQQAGSQAQQPSGGQRGQQSDADRRDGESAGQQGTPGESQGGNAGAQDEAGGQGDDPRNAQSDPAGGADDGQSGATPLEEQEGFAEGSQSEPDTGEGNAEEGDPDGAESGLARSEDLSEEEAARATEQWLRRIPDDPGGLLRRKFLYQYRQQQAARGFDAPGVQRDEPEPW